MAFNEGASSGNLVLIQKQTASGAATVSFTNIPAAYDNLQIVAYGLHGNTASTFGRFRISYDNGSTYKSDATYTTTALAWDSAGNQGFYAAAETSGRWLQLLDNTANSQSACVTTVYGANSSAAFQVIKHQGGGNLSFNSNWDYSTFYYGSAGIINAIQFFPNAGTVTGTFKLYGFQN